MMGIKDLEGRVLDSVNSGTTGPLRPMNTAPTDGEVILSFWRNTPVFIAWVDMPDRRRVHRKGIWPFVSRTVEIIPERGWRVLMLCRDGQYGVHGNYDPFSPPGWLPIPALQIAETPTLPLRNPSNTGSSS